MNKLHRVAYIWCLAVGGLLVSGATVAVAQPPESVLIQGQLLDSAGAPIEGLRQYRVRFFDAETDGTQLGGDLTDFTQVGPQGLFAIALVPPAAALNAPEAWYELALDSSTPAVGVGSDDVFPQRVPVHSVPFARKALESAELAGEAFVMVRTTSDSAQNGANLQAAYAEAAALEPHGELLSEDNRAVVVVPPGKYDLGDGHLLLDTEFVDLVGLTALRENQYIFGASSGPGTGVLRQTADNVRIENLTVHCTRDSGSLANDASDPAAYFPDGDLPETVMRNCSFLADDTSARSMRVAIEYSGTYENVHGESRIFGGEGGIASGTFIDCTGGFRAFGGGGTASGTFVDCTATTGAFGGQGGTASGTFTRCVGGNSAFGGGNGGTASGTFSHCTGGPWAFGGQGTAADGEFYFCVGGLGALTTEGSPAHFYCVRNGVAIP